jgi:hypothetical protein
MSRGDSTVSTIIGLIIIGIIIYGIAQLLIPDRWRGFYQSYSGQPVTQEFDSKQTCLDWIHSQYGVDKECGSNCRLTDAYSGYVCDETID